MSSVKTYKRIIISLIICLIFTAACAVGTFAAKADSAHVYTVSDYAASRLSGENVTISVYRRGYTPDTDAPIKDAVCYRDQTKTDSNGKFTFEFCINGGDKNCVAYVRCAGESSVRVYELDDQNDIFCDRFENYNSDSFFQDMRNDGYTTVGKSIYAGSYDAKHGTSAVIKPTGGSVTIGRTLGSVQSDGVVLISFEALFTQTDNLLCMRIHGQSPSDLYQAMAFTSSAKVGYYRTMKGWDFVSDTTYSANEWNHVNIWIDLYRRKASIYVGEHFLGQTDIDSGLSQISGITLLAEKDTGGEIYIDNLRVVRLRNSVLKTLGGGIPEYLRQKVVPDPVLGTDGNIFTSLRDKIHVSLYNFGDETANAGVVYTVTDSDGNTVEIKTSDGVNLAEGRNQTTVVFDNLKYGLMNIHIGVYSRDGELLGQTQSKMSVVNPAIGKTDCNRGVVIHYNNGNIKSQVDAAARAGFGIIRAGLTWNAYCAAGNTIPQKFAELCTYAEQYGMKLIVPLSYSSFDTQTACPPYTDSEINAFAQFCRDVSQKLTDDVYAFEVWNEYNIERFNPDGRTAADYARMLKSVYAAIKADGTDSAKVVGIVSSGTPTAWISDVFEALGGERCFDAVSVHPYDSHNSPESGSKTLAERVGSVRNIMNNFGCSDIELWITEIGWPSVREVTGEFATAAQQAEYLVRTYVLNDANSLADKVVVYNLQNDGSDAANRENNFGLLETWRGFDVPGAAKPAYAAMANFNAMSYGYTYSDTITVSDSCRAYRYTNTSGDELYITWSGGASEQVSINPGEKAVFVYDMYGNAIPYSAANGVVNVTVGQETMYIAARNIDISVKSGGKDVYCIEDISDGKITVSMVESAGTDADIYLAAYTDSKDMSGAFVVNSGGLRDEKRFSADIDLSNIDIAECIRIFVFDRKNLRPVINDITIKHSERKAD